MCHAVQAPKMRFEQRFATVETQHQAERKKGMLLPG
jgi:hypothetical protein